MPSTSKKQHNFMQAVAHSPAFAKKVGVPQSVGKDFSTADKGRKFKEGGDMKESKEMVKKEIGFMKKAGAPKPMIKHEKAEAGMKKGGVPAALAKHAAKPAAEAHKGLTAKGKPFAKGGGIETKGKTKGTMVKMCGGGMTKKK